MDDRQQREVAEGLRNGRQAAWRALYGEFSQQVWRHVARRLGPNPADVADVVQETFLAAARSARGFDAQRGSLWSWLRGIANNQLALHFRQSMRRDDAARLQANVASSNGRLVKWLDGGPLPPEALEAVETASLVRAALLQLRDEYADLLTAKYVDDLSMEEIAEREGGTITATSSKLARARRAFREAFAAQPQKAS